MPRSHMERGLKTVGTGPSEMQAQKGDLAAESLMAGGRNRTALLGAPAP